MNGALGVGALPRKPNMSGLQQHLVLQIQELCNAEQNLVAALGTMSQAACEPELRAAFIVQQVQAQDDFCRLQQFARSHSVNPQGKRCESIRFLVDSTLQLIQLETRGPVLDALLICAGRKAHHHQISCYATMIGWAKQLEFRRDLELLEEILDEKQDADRLLNKIGRKRTGESPAQLALRGCSPKPAVAVI